MNYYKFLSFLLLLLVALACNKEELVPEEGAVNKSANLQVLGSSAEDLLSAEEFTSIRIEMVYVAGYEPSQKTIDNLSQFLKARTHKPDGVSIFKRAVTTSGKSPFDIDEIVDIEAQERSAYNAGDEITVFIYFADGSHEDDSSNKIILGSAYRNTSMVIYGKTVQEVADRLNAPDKSTVESTVVNHEFGHLFGLVNMGTPLQQEHEDETSNGHCETSGCLMNANVQFGGDLIDMINNNTVPQLDDLCIQDLQEKGGK